nr:hypothetical protein [Fodinicola feengrottensis]
MALALEGDQQLVDDGRIIVKQAQITIGVAGGVQRGSAENVRPVGAQHARVVGRDGETEPEPAGLGHLLTKMVGQETGGELVVC